MNRRATVAYCPHCGVSGPSIVPGRDAVKETILRCMHGERGRGRVTHCPLCSARNQTAIPGGDPVELARCNVCRAVMSVHSVDDTNERIAVAIIAWDGVDLSPVKQSTPRGCSGDGLLPPAQPSLEIRHGSIPRVRALPLRAGERVFSSVFATMGEEARARMIISREHWETTFSSFKDGLHQLQERAAAGDLDEVQASLVDAIAAFEMMQEQLLAVIDDKPTNGTELRRSPLRVSA